MLHCSLWVAVFRHYTDHQLSVKLMLFLLSMLYDQSVLIQSSLQEKFYQVTVTVVV